MHVKINMSNEQGHLLIWEVAHQQLFFRLIVLRQGTCVFVE